MCVRNTQAISLSKCCMFSSLFVVIQWFFLFQARCIAGTWFAAELLSDVWTNSQRPFAYAWHQRSKFVSFFCVEYFRNSFFLNNVLTAALLEAMFSCWGLLFKYLHRRLLHDIAPLFIRFEPLFHHRRPYIRLFAAQSFAFLVRYIFFGVESSVFVGFKQTNSLEYIEN